MFHPLRQLARMDSLVHTCTLSPVAHDKLTPEEKKGASPQILAFARLHESDLDALYAYLERGGKKWGRSSKQMVRSHHVRQGAELSSRNNIA